MNAPENASVSAPVNRILRSSIVDGPGNRAVVFLQGCNYDCVYCHNPETIALCGECGLCVGVCPADALSGGAGNVNWERARCAACDACIKTCPRSASPRVRRMTPEQVMSEIEPARAFIRGVTVSGGECTLYPAFLRALATLSSARALSFFIDSNGSYDFEADAALTALADGVMLDVKADAASYARVTGTQERGAETPDGSRVLEQVEYLEKKEKLWEIRTVVCPGLFDVAAAVEAACRVVSRGRIAGRSERLLAPDGNDVPRAVSARYKLIRYRPFGVRPSFGARLASPDDALMAELAAICADYGIESVTV